MVLNGADFTKLYRSVLAIKTFPEKPKDLDVYIKLSGKKTRPDFTVVNDFIDFVESNGFSVGVSVDDNSLDITRTYNVSLVNADFFVEEPVNFTIDVAFTDDLPPFRKIDFSCNSMIWSKYGLSFSTNCGIDADNLPFLQRKIYEAQTAHLMMSKRTIINNFVYPGFPPINPMHPDNVSSRKKFFMRIMKMWRRGWMIQNFKDVGTTSKNTDRECYICQEAPDDGEMHMKFSCCKGVMHLDCFEKYVLLKLDVRITVPCPGTPDTTWDFFFLLIEKIYHRLSLIHDPQTIL